MRRQSENARRPAASFLWWDQRSSGGGLLRRDRSNSRVLPCQGNGFRNHLWHALSHPSGSTDFDEQGRIKGTLGIPLNERGAGQAAQTDQPSPGLGNFTDLFVSVPVRRANGGGRSRRLWESVRKRSTSWTPFASTRIMALQNLVAGSTVPAQGLPPDAGATGNHLPARRRAFGRSQAASRGGRR